MLEGGGKDGDEDVVLRYLPETQLPSDASQRLEILFEARASWTLHSLEAYLLPITRRDRTMMDALLLKHCRKTDVLAALPQQNPDHAIMTSHQGQTTVYTSRKGFS